MPTTHGDPDTCQYCGDHTAEPRLPCCDNSSCKAEYVKESRER